MLQVVRRLLARRPLAGHVRVGLDLDRELIECPLATHFQDIVWRQVRLAQDELFDLTGALDGIEVVGGMRSSRHGLALSARGAIGRAQGWQLAGTGCQP